MNHYPRHIGDWMRDTAHLSEVEECIYSRCIDQYYSREKPLPVDQAQVCRLVRALTKEAKKAVATILAEFFTLEADGWRQKRCDAELARYQEKAERNRAVGMLGGRPKKTQTVTEENPEITQTVSKTEPKNNPNQEPIASNQQTHSAGVLAKAIREAGIGSVNPGDPRLLALVEVGATPDEMRSAASEATAKGKGFAYALAIAEGRRKDASRLASLPNAQKVPEVFT